MPINRRQFLGVGAGALAAATLPTPATAETRNGMPYRELGGTGERVSLLCVGGYHIGMHHISEKKAIEIMRTAVDEGVNFFDNAWHYHGGRSEERMGKALKDGYRDKVFLMTKHHGRDAQVAEEHLNESLRRFDVDVIDLWQFHEVTAPDTPQKIYESGVLDFCLKAQEQGKIRYIGFTGHFLPFVLADMVERGFPWDALQMPLSVSDAHYRSFEQEVLPKAAEKNIGVLAMKCLGGSPGAIPNVSRTCTVEECLHYAMSLPVASIVSGMETMEKLQQNIAAARNFKPLGADARTELLARTREAALTGKLEPHKSAWHRNVWNMYEDEIKRRGVEA